MARKQLVYKIGYYEEDKRFGWTNTLYDNVIAKSEKEALANRLLTNDVHCSIILLNQERGNRDEVLQGNNCTSISSNNICCSHDCGRCGSEEG